MPTSPIGLQMLEQREGTRLKPYNDSAGHCTVGIGHLIHHGRCTQADYDRWTLPNKQAAIDLFRKDLAATYERAVDENVKVPLTPNQYDSLVSLCFNIGVNGFKKSTVLRRLNARDYEGAATAFMMWNKPKEIIGRRRGEMAQFRTPYGNQTPVTPALLPPSAPAINLLRGPSKLFGKAEWLHPVFRIRLEAVHREVPFICKSGGRSRQRQTELYNAWRAYKEGRSKVRANSANRPGTSWHEYDEDGSTLAQAADIHPLKGHTFAQLHAAGKRHGVHFPVDSEDWHAQPIEAKSSKRTAGQGLGPVPAYYRPDSRQEDDVSVKRIIRTQTKDGSQVIPDVFEEIDFAWVKWIPNNQVWDEIKRYASAGVDEPVVVLRGEFEALEKVGTGPWPTD